MKKIIYCLLLISVCIVPLSSFSFSFSKVDTTTHLFKISKYIKNNFGVGVGVSARFSMNTEIREPFKKYGDINRLGIIIPCTDCNQEDIKNALNYSNDYKSTNQYLYISYQPEKSFKHTLEFNFKWINNQTVVGSNTYENEKYNVSYKKFSIKYIPYFRIKSKVGKRNGKSLFLMPTLSYAYVSPNIIQSYDNTWSYNTVKHIEQTINSSKFTISRNILNLQFAYNKGMFKNKQAIELGFYFPLLARFTFKNSKIGQSYNTYANNNLTYSNSININYPTKTYFYYLFKKSEKGEYGHEITIRPPVGFYFIYHLYNSKNTRQLNMKLLRLKNKLPVLGYLAFTFNPYLNAKNVGMPSWSNTATYDYHKISAGSYIAEGNYSNSYFKTGFKLAKGLEAGYKFKKMRPTFYTGCYFKATDYGRDLIEPGRNYKRKENAIYLGFNSPIDKENTDWVRPYYGFQLMYKNTDYNVSINYFDDVHGGGTVHHLSSSSNQYWLQGTFGGKTYLTKLLYIDMGISYSVLSISQIRYSAVSTTIDAQVFPNTKFESIDNGNRWYFNGPDYLFKNLQMLNTVYLKVGIALTNKQ